jgi:hypothetical protein
MVAGGLPTIQVLLDDGTGTFPYDITTYARLVEGYTCKRGRQDELSSVTAGDFTLTLDNTDGRFTVGSTIIASPSPIKMDAQVQVRVTPSGGSAVTRFTQFVQSWPTEWPDGSDLFSVAAISGTDAQARAERQGLGSVPATEIVSDGPFALFRLNEAAGASDAGDSSGNQRPTLTIAGSGAAPVFGDVSGPTTDGFTAAEFTNGQCLVGALSFDTVPTSVCIGFFFNTSLTPNDQPIGRLYSGAPAGGTWAFGLTNVPGAAHLGITNGATALSATPANLNDGKWHHAFFVFTGTTVTIYADGQTGGALATATLTLDRSMTLEIGGVTSALPSGPASFTNTGYTGSLAHVSVFNGAGPSAARIAAEAAAGVTGFNTDLGPDRLTRLATYANLPLGTLDAGLTTISAFSDDQQSVAGAIQDVADAEMGLAYFDGTGSLVFHNRNRVAAKTSPDVTIDANFLAEGTRFEYDMQGVVNYFQVTAQGTGASQLVQNVTSQVTNKHGRYDSSKTYLVQTDAEALDRGNWVVSTHAEPAARVGSLVIDVLTMTAAQQQQMLTIEPDSWLRVTGLPGQTVGGTTADFIVQGFADVLNVGEWTLTLNATNKPVLYPSVWILDDTTYSVLDSTTRLYV